MTMDEMEKNLDLEDKAEPIEQGVLDGLKLPENGKSCAMLCGEPEVIQKLMESLLGMADFADEQGMREEADALSALIADVKMIKAAQYEGFQNYWLANTRAFELAFKNRFESQKEDKKSFHQAWMETLQDYMDSLLGPQTEYIGKNLKTAQYEGFQNYWLMNSRAFELAFKKKLEAQSEKEKSFCKAWMETLEDYQDCEERQDFLEKALTKTASVTEEDMALAVFAEADRRKVTLADLYCEWADCHKEALTGFLVVASNKIQNGVDAPTAVYEALDYYASGAHSRNTARRILSIANKIEDNLKKKTGLMDKIRQMWWKVKSGAADFWDWITFQRGVAKQHINRLTSMGKWFIKQYNRFKSELKASPKAAIDPATLNRVMAPYLEELRSVVQLIKAPGSAARIPEMPELIIGGSVNPMYWDSDINGMGLHQFESYMSDISDILAQVELAAKDYDESLKEGTIGTTGPSKAGGFEMILVNAVSVATSRLAQEFKAYSNTINFANMINDIKAVPWAAKIDEAAKNAGIVQGKAMSRGSVSDATTDLVGVWMDVVNGYLNSLIQEIKTSTSPNNVRAKNIQQVENMYRKSAGEITARLSDLIMEKFDLGA